MEQINLLLERLKSLNKYVDPEAYKGLRRTLNLTLEQINVLGLVKTDCDPSVAHAAQITLLFQRLKLNNIFRILGWIALMGTGLMAFWFLFEEAGCA